MNLNIRSRQTGKTTDAIREAAATGATLIVPNKNMAKLAERMAKDMELDINVMDIWEYSNTEIDSRPDNIILDNAYQIIAHYFAGSKILSMYLEEEALRGYKKEV